jgi:ADP-ribosyl-[dinitrogen reductase] hydrolase
VPRGRDLRRITRGLRFRLTAAYAVVFTLVMAGVAWYLRASLMRELDDQSHAVLNQEWAAVKGYLRIEKDREIGKNFSNWYYAADDPDEATIVADIKKIYMIADENGNLIQDATTKEQEYSTTYDDLGIDPPALVKRRVREAVTAMATQKPGTPGKAFWDVRRDSRGERYLIRAGIVLDEGRLKPGQHLPYYVAIGVPLEDYDKILNSFTYRYLALIPSALILGSLLGWFMTGRVLTPVVAVAQTAQRISSSNLSLRIPPRQAGDELDYLIHTFNRMIERLEGSFHQIKQFSTDVSHELRTPITGIRGQLEVALFTAKTTEQYREAMFNALQDIDRLSQIVRALLLLSQAESGQLVLQKARMDLSEVLGDLVEQFQIPAEESGIRLTADLPPECPAEVDRVQIERMINNLLSNALKFTPRGGERADRARPHAGAGGDCRGGHRPRHRHRAPAPHLRPVLPGPRLGYRALSRARSRAGVEFRGVDRQSARRQDPRGQHAGGGDALRHHPPRRRHRLGHAGTAARGRSGGIKPGRTMSAPKTSLSDPLIVNRVRVREGGDIGLTFCPGKRYHGYYSGAWERDLAADLGAIHAFGGKALVTLMEDRELKAVQVPPDVLAGEAKRLGIEWHHLPVADVDVPNERFEDQWTYSGVRLRGILAAGGNVVIHCLGGLGRTGTIAARLLVEFGASPESAIRQVREARPGSIETPRQEEYVERCRPVAGARTPLSREERVLACLLGGAIGDAFGYEVEFKSLAEIRARFSPAGILAPVLHQGLLVVSDDTQMTLFTLEGLLRAAVKGHGWETAAIPSIREAYLDWLCTQNGPAVTRNRCGWLARQAVMCAPRAPGGTCLSALHAGGRGTIGQPANNSKGCGGAMRTAPIGFLTLAPASEVFRLAAEAAALTHGHPSGYLSAGMAAALVRAAMDGASLSDAIDPCCRILETWPNHGETLAAVRGAVRMAADAPASHAAAVERLGGGWVGEEALAIALYAVLSARSYGEAIAIAANHGGDSDSTASIAGQLWGAAHGLGGIPHEWVRPLDVLPPLLHLARGIPAACFPAGLQ